MDELPIWETPHRYTAGDGRGVFTYGLLIAELPSLLQPDRIQRLAEHWGAFEVVELARVIAPDAAGISAIDPFSDPEVVERARVMARDAGIEGFAELRPAGQPLPEASGRNVSLAIRGGPSLQRFIAALAQAAASADRVPEHRERNGRSSLWAEECRWFLRAAEAPRGFNWAHRGGERVRVPAYRHLLDRVAIEYEHLVMQRPVLARCQLCGRVFVPRRQYRPERNCYGDLWLASTPPLHLAPCGTLDAELERVRGQKRLAARYRRLLARYGPSDERVKAAKAAHAQWNIDHPPARRGRQARPEPGYQPEGDPE